MSEILFHPGDPKRKVRSARISPALGAALALLLVAMGTATTLGLLGASDLISDLVRSAERFALRETARRGAEAYSSVQRQTTRLVERLAAAELFLARLAAAVEVPAPDGFPAGVPERIGTDLAGDVATLARRLRAAEIFRRKIAAATNAWSRDEAARVPSRAPVEPTVAVPVVTFGPRESPVTRRQEFFAGLALAAPAGAAVVAPASGTVVWAGPVPPRLGAEWRPLGNVVVLAHDARTLTLFGHLERPLVRPRQRVRRGDEIGRVGTSGFTPAPRLHYEVRRLEGSRFVPKDPRLFVLDAEWITAAQVRGVPQPPPDADLPPPLR